MNTFLPFPSFAECARVHPTRALHRQIIEADDCLRHLLQDPKYPPRRKTGHPCVEMWRGSVAWLQCYRDHFFEEWIGRNLARPQDFQYTVRATPRMEWDDPEPEWLGDPDLHRIYREHMLSKYGEDPTTCLEAGETHQPDEWFIQASKDWTETPVYHKPLPFPTP